MAADQDLVERLLVQLRDDVTAGFAHAARATDLARVEGQLQAYQKETDRRLEVLEVAEHGRAGSSSKFRLLWIGFGFLASQAALWAAVVTGHR